MEYFLHSADLPFSGIRLFYREINVKEQILLGKIAILYPFGEENNNDYITAFEKILINCVENKDDFYKINILDYILFLTKLRILSIDNNLELEFQDNDEKNLKPKFTIDLANFMKNLYQVAIDTKLSEEIEYKSLKVKLNWPSIKSKIVLLENKKNIIPTIPEFIEKITIDKDQVISFENFESYQKEEVYSKLPISFKNKIENKIFKSIEELVNKNLFDIKGMDWFKFNLYDSSYFHFFRLMFSCNLKQIYQEYYLLASKNISLSYVDNMSIPDKKVYCSMVEEEFNLKSKRNQPIGNPSDGSMSLSDLIKEFEG